MSQTFTRYTKSYLQLARQDVANYFPKNVFLKDPNISNRFYDVPIKVTTEDVLKSTVHKVSEPFSNTELYIIGTTNTSNILANRTKRLIDQIKPDTVFVQTSEDWWKGASHLSFIKSQEEMDKANTETSLKHYACIPSSLKSGFSLSSVKFHFFNLVFKGLLGFPVEFNPFRPGLEIKYAIEEAEKLNSKVIFMGNEFDSTTVNRFHHEKRHTLLKAISKILKLSSSYKSELFHMKAQLSQYQVKQYIESTTDSKQMAYFISILDKIYPELKRILVDKKDEDLFRTIIKNKGKIMVAVVNQHHMEGLEHHWCSAYGQTPMFNKNYIGKIDPIGDMDLRRSLYNSMYHVIMRDIKSSRSRASPASFTNEINIYHREFNHQYEHRNM